MKDSSGRGSYRILVVDDDRYFQDVYEHVLEDVGFEVEKSFEGSEALERLGDDLPDVVLLDLLMPRCDGYEVLSRLSGDERFEGIPVVVYSNFSHSDTVERAFQMGADHYLKKMDYTPKKLAQKIVSILNARQKKTQSK